MVLSSFATEIQSADVRSYSHTDGVCHCFSARNKQLSICDVASFRSPPSPHHQHVQVNAVSRTDG